MIWAVLFIMTLNGPQILNAMRVESMEQCEEVAMMTERMFPGRFVVCVEEGIGT